jgi:hypothetical protein
MNQSPSSASASELEALVKRVRSAKAPDRDLDKAVWQAVASKPANDSDAAITGSVDAGVKLIESLLPGWQWKLQRHKGGEFYKATLQPPEGAAIRGYNETVPALAVVDGLLRALLEHPPK